MHYRETRKHVQKGVTAGLIGLFIFMLAACASNMVAKQDDGNVAEPPSESPPKMITDISVSDAPGATVVSINGNKLLTYTSVKQPLPLGLVLYFPETSLGIAKTEYTIDNSVLDSIKAIELIENGPSKITIALKEDATYDIARDGNGLSVTFNTMIAEAETLEPSAETAEPKDDIETAELVEEGPVAPVAETAVEAAVEPAPAEDDFAQVVAQAEAEETPSPVLVPSIETSAGEDGSGLDVMIKTGSAVQDFKSFSLEDPPRIVFDLQGVISSYQKLQTVAVDTQWVKSVRHFAYPDRVRVVLDTDKEYLDAFSALPDDNGLIVHVGKKPAEVDSDQPEPMTASAESATEEQLPAEAPQPEEEPEQTVAALDRSVAQESSAPVEPTLAAAAPAAASTSAVETPAEVAAPVVKPEEAAPAVEAEVEAVVAPEVDAQEVRPSEAGAVEEAAVATETSDLKPAFVNRIDFLSHDEGTSSVIVGTTKPAQYSLEKLSEQKLQLNLKDTKIFSYRQRPLITTRFESAVDRILPIQTADMTNDSIIVVELREAVPYRVEQDGNEIQIFFEASSIPPKQLPDTDLPPWQQVMEESAEEVQTAQALEPPVQPEAELAMTEAPMEPAPVVAEDVPVVEEPVIVETPPEKDDMDEVAEAMAVEPVEDISPDKPAVEEEAKAPGKKYVGEKIALDFYQTDIKNVLRILRDVSGKNFAVDDDVTGKVTLTLVKPVPWDQVLDLILKMNNLGKSQEGDIVRIVTMSTLQKEEELKAEALKAKNARQKQEEALEPLVTEYIPISYADASEDIKPRLDEIKTPDRGNVGVDLRNNQIIMTDVPKIIEQAKRIVRQIDKVTPQVIIEARIVEVNEGYSRELGTEWGMSGLRDTTTDPGVTATSDWSVAMNNPPSTQSGTIGYNFARITNSFSLNAQLQAIESTDKGKIISNPKVVTLDNKEATIKQGLEYPYLERDSSGLATVKFKDVDLELKVTPHVTPDNRIAMKIDIVKNDVESLIDGVPSLSTNEAQTELLVNDGDTIVIGGIMKTTAGKTVTGFPLLSKIPLLGWAFKSEVIQNDRNELLIFITPRIVLLEQNI